MPSTWREPVYFQGLKDMRVGIDCQETRRLYEKLKIGCSDQTKPDNSWQAHFSKPAPNQISTAAAQQSDQTPVERFNPSFLTSFYNLSLSVCCARYDDRTVLKERFEWPHPHWAHISSQPRRDFISGLFSWGNNRIPSLPRTMRFPSTNRTRCNGTTVSVSRFSKRDTPKGKALRRFSI